MAARTEIRHAEEVANVAPIWDTMQQEARAAAEADPLLAAFLYSTILSQSSLEDSVIHRICERLDNPDMQAVDRKSTRLNSSHQCPARMPSSACKNHNTVH